MSDVSEEASIVWASDFQNDGVLSAMNEYQLRVSLKGVAIALDTLRTELTATQEKLAAAEKENTHLRAALATSKDPCIYCQLPAEEMAKCRSGFPGCSRADDITGCPEFGAMMNEASLREELTTAQAQIQAARERDLRLVSFAARIGNSEGYWATADTEILARFNTQDNSNE